MMTFAFRRSLRGLTASAIFAAGGVAAAAPGAPPTESGSGFTGRVLVVVSCAEAAPDQCETHRFPLGAQRGVCFMPMELPRLVRPGWRVARWGCERPDEARVPVEELTPYAGRSLA